MNSGTTQVTPSQVRGFQQNESFETVVYESAKKLVASPKFKVGFVLWAFGLFLCLFAKAPFQIAEEKLQQYDKLLNKAYSGQGYRELEDKLFEAEARLEEVHVWFWRYREPFDKLVPERKKDVAQIVQQINALNAERDKTLNQAKQTVGIWSQFSIDEAKERFWSAFEKGKIFAKQRSFWDALFMMMDRREKNMLSFMLSWVLKAVLNFTLGLLGSLFYFVFAVVSMAYNYSPDILSGIVFVSLAILSAASVVVTYLLGVYGCVFGGVYLTGKVIQHNMQQQRLEYESQHGRLGQGQQARNRNSTHYHRD